MSTPSVVICGAGVIGLSTAYYLSLLAPTEDILVLDTSSSLFSCASGRAGGFLAADWFSPSSAALGALSFRLHRELSAQHGGGVSWGYAPSVAYSVSGLSSPMRAPRGEDWLTQGSSRATAATVAGSNSKFPAWLAPAQAELISTSKSTAQVDPERLCQFLLAECKKRGVQIQHPVTPSSIAVDDSSRVSAITYTAGDGASYTISCTSLILTAGVWTPTLFRTLLPSAPKDLPISALSGHSLVMRSPRWTPAPVQEGEVPTECAAIFASDNGYGFSPELFSRAHGEIYIAGHNASTSSSGIEKTADLTKPNELALDDLRNCAAYMLGVPKGELDVVRGQFCHRPVGPLGQPLVTQLDAKHTGGVSGVFVAAGHGPWGISQSLGTGMVVAEMVLGRKLSADISRLGL